MPRRKDIGLARRRVRTDEDEADNVEGVETVEDSVSEESGLSDEDEDDDDNESDATLSEDEEHDTVSEPLPNGKPSKLIVGRRPVLTTSGPGTGDTQAMLNGVTGDDAGSEMDFADMDEQGQESKVAVSVRKERKRRAKAEVEQSTEPLEETGVSGARPESLFEKRKREHEEYRKKRDADPAFVPNRGAFFMHDSRSGVTGPNGFRPFGRGRGRGGPVFGSVSSEPTESSWKHDMHDTIAAAERERERLREIRERTTQLNKVNGDANFGNMQRGFHRNAPTRSFNTTVTKGVVPIRVSLAGMKQAKVVSDFSVKVYTRLPIHRPPLRRDKPVRISLPDSQPRYVYPAHDRSFTFIPRQMRPGGSGFARGGIVGGGLGPTPSRGRGSFSGHYRDSTYGGSTYGSAYAGSNYAASNGMSRRSSMAQDIGRVGAEQPYDSQAQARARVPPKPVVRLPSNPAIIATSLEGNAPQNSQAEPLGIANSNTTSDSQALFKAALEQQAFNPESTITMHQPVPQKSVSIDNIESPAGMAYAHNYPQMHEFPVPPFFHQHSRASSYPSQPSSTPHSQIPEQSVHARPFQPSYPTAPPNSYYIYPPHAAPHPQMYSSHHQVPMPHHNGPPPPYVPSPNAMPYVPHHGMQPSPMMPMQPSAMIPMQAMLPPSPHTTAQAPPSTMIAQESNGMVYYIDPNQYFATYGTYPPGTAPFTPAADPSNSMMYYPQMMPMPIMGNGQPLYYMP